MMNILLSCLLLCFSIIANASDSSTMEVDSSQNSFVVKLAANPTTGFQWTVVNFDKKLLDLSKGQYQKPQTELIGAGGQMIYTFTLKKGKSYPEKTNMIFKYGRSWEPQSATLKRVTVYFLKNPKS